MRNFIDTVKPDSALINLYITVKPNSITSLYFFVRTVLKSSTPEMEKDVMLNGVDETTGHRRNFWNSRTFLMHSDVQLIYWKNNKNFYIKLASKPKKLQVKTFRTNVVNVPQVLHILPHLDDVKNHRKSFRIEHDQPDFEHLMDPRYAGPHIHSDQFDHATYSWFFPVSTPKRVLNVSLCPYEVCFDFERLVDVPKGVTIN
ncbi:hypothetical protein CRE_13621 [Caenorhabditis remanei]|uniref:DUF38 domain-containing protein n=1 Tax=Caenorhabditis remanei TaxID=31234 RepID=E3N1B3_CAERE|nr:hypothetical protein CRE_13621 [Caenorhabditis remanei]